MIKSYINFQLYKLSFFSFLSPLLYGTLPHFLNIISLMAMYFCSLLELAWNRKFLLWLSLYVTNSTICYILNFYPFCKMWRKKAVVNDGLVILLPSCDSQSQLWAKSERRETQVLWLQKFSNLEMPVAYTTVPGFHQIPSKLLNFWRLHVLD